METSAILERLTATRHVDRAAALEAAVCLALGWPLDEVPVRDLGLCYRRISETLLDAVQLPGSRTGDIAIGSEALVDGVWGLIYGARTFHVAHRLIQAYALHDGHVLDVGGGWGAASLAAGARGQSTTVIDASNARIDFGRRLFCALGLSHDFRRQSLHASSRLPTAGTTIFAYSLREMVHSPAEAVDLLLPRLGEGDATQRILLLEAGARGGAEFLMEVRDRLFAAGQPLLAPCSASTMCPLRAQGDWCHFTWRMPLGPLGQRVAAIAGRKAHDVHVAWLLLGAAPRKTDGRRLLNIRSIGKQGDRVTFCAPGPGNTIDVPRKLAKRIPALADRQPGALVKVPLLGVERRLKSHDGWIQIETI